MFALHFFQKLFYEVKKDEVKKDADEVDRKMKEREQEFEKLYQQGARKLPKKNEFPL